MIAGAMDIVLKAASGSGDDARKTREFADQMLTSAGLSVTEPPNYAADKERVFLDPVCWALFSAYRQCSMYPTMLLHVARVGVGPKILEGSSSVLQTLKSALPEQAAYVEEAGLGALPHLLEPLEQKLLAALDASLNGQSSSEASVRHAAEIIEKVNAADAALKARNKVAVQDDGTSMA